MITNLNNLEIEEIKNLEKHVLQIDNADEIKAFFVALKSGKLRNKNIEIDALDFVYDGLSEMVEDYFKEIETSKVPEEKVDITRLKRSENLNFKKQIDSNHKFISGNYIYLFHGDEAGKKEGFFTYQFAKDGINISEYIGKNKDLSLEEIAYQHSMLGKGKFISATTHLPTAESFANEHNNGSVYVIRIRKNDAYRVESPIDEFMQILEEDKNALAEDEYLIPDCVYPNEVIKEFKCYEYRKLFEYLTRQLGLQITPQDIGMTEISEDEEKARKLKDEMYAQFHKKVLSKYDNAPLPKNTDEFKAFMQILENFKDGIIPREDDEEQL